VTHAGRSGSRKSAYEKTLSSLLALVLEQQHAQQKLRTLRRTVVASEPITRPS
jgi:hypothetical protein